MSWRAYLVRCADGSLYAGVSTDVAARVAAHNAGRGARYTRARRPVILAWRSPVLDKTAAHRLEWRLKQLSAREKRLITAPQCAARRRLVRQLLIDLRPTTAVAINPAREQEAQRRRGPRRID